MMGLSASYTTIITNTRAVEVKLSDQVVKLEETDDRNTIDVYFWA
jgi:hypothetical protein